MNSQLLQATTCEHLTDSDVVEALKERLLCLRVGAWHRKKKAFQMPHLALGQLSGTLRLSLQPQ
eukprot:560084-Amphidinium_carterae.2